VYWVPLYNYFGQIPKFLFFIYFFSLYFQTDIIDPENQRYSGIDFIKYLYEYLDKMNLGEVEFSVFKYQQKSNLPAFIANIKVIYFRHCFIAVDTLTIICLNL